jgi:hypothetical protein
MTMNQNIFWTAYTNKDRFVAIGEIEAIVGKFGYITDFRRFSDLSISIQMEVAEYHIDALYDTLAACMSLKEFDKLASASGKERVIYLNVNFIKGTGDVRYEIPAVPG